MFKNPWLSDGLGVDSIENPITRAYLIKSCIGADMPLECLQEPVGSSPMRLNRNRSLPYVSTPKTSVEALDALEWAIKFMRDYERKHRKT